MSAAAVVATDTAAAWNVWQYCKSVDDCETRYLYLAAQVPFNAVIAGNAYSGDFSNTCFLELSRNLPEHFEWYSAFWYATSIAVLWCWHVVPISTRFRAISGWSEKFDFNFLRNYCRDSDVTWQAGARPQPVHSGYLHCRHISPGVQ